MTIMDVEGPRPVERPDRPAPKFLDVEQVAEILGVDRIVVLAGIRRGQFVVVRVGGRQMINRAAFDAWLEAVERHCLAQVAAYVDHLEE